MSKRLMNALLILMEVLVIQSALKDANSVSFSNFVKFVKMGIIFPNKLSSVLNARMELQGS